MRVVGRRSGTRRSTSLRDGKFPALTRMTFKTSFSFFLPPIHPSIHPSLYGTITPLTLSVCPLRFSSSRNSIQCNILFHFFSPSSSSSSSSFFSSYSPPTHSRFPLIPPILVILLLSLYFWRGRMGSSLLSDCRFMDRSIGRSLYHHYW